MRNFILKITVLTVLAALSACGTCEHVHALAMRPAKSTYDAVYTGKCPSTYNEHFTYYEVTWSDGNTGCYPRELIENGEVNTQGQDFCGPN